MRLDFERASSDRLSVWVNLEGVDPRIAAGCPHVMFEALILSITACFTRSLPVTLTLALTSAIIAALTLTHTLEY